MIPGKDLFGGQPVTTHKMYARESPKIDLIHYLGMLEFTGICTAYIIQRAQIKTKLSTTSPVSPGSCWFIMPEFRRAAAACISFTFHQITETAQPALGLLLQKYTEQRWIYTTIITDFRARSDCCYCQDGVCLQKPIDLGHCILDDVVVMSKT